MIDASHVVQQCHERAAVIAVLGLGHVGLPTALCLAELGWRVIGADSDPRKIAAIL